MTPITWIPQKYKRRASMFWNVKVIRFHPLYRDEVCRVEALSSGGAQALVVEKLQENLSHDYLITRVEGPFT